MEGSFALGVQLLDHTADKVLLLGYLAELRSDSGWFSPPQVKSLFDDLRIPTSNVHYHLKGLTASRLLVAKNGVYALTPLGRKHAMEVSACANPDHLLAVVAAETQGEPGAVFGDGLHVVIPPEFAPARWRTGILRLLDEFPFERNVFCMTRFPAGEEDPVATVIQVAREATAAHGLTLHLASDRSVDDELFGNVGAYMWACRYGLVLVEDLKGSGLNHNVMAEVGAMLMTGRRCAILKDDTIERLPTDLVGHVYKPVSFNDLDGVAREINAWILDDLGIGT
jgi:hypothetical protein